jgi:hypothetical protein
MRSRQFVQLRITGTKLQVAAGAVIASVVAYAVHRRFRLRS